MPQEAPRPGAALFQRLFGRPPEADSEESQLRTLFQLLGATLHQQGNDYLEALAVHLTDLLNIDLCLISRMDAEKHDLVRVEAQAQQGCKQEPVPYSVKDTPCEIVMQGSEYFVGDGLIEAFPADEMLREFGLCSYYGIPLWGDADEVIGLICLLDTKPIEDAGLARDVVGMFAQRASAEMARIQAREQAEATDEFLDSFFRDFPGWVCGYSTDHGGEEREIVFSNGQAVEFFGPRNYELLRRDATQFNTLLHPEDRARVEAIYREARESLGSYDLEYRVRHDDGSYRWVQSTGCFSVKDDGRCMSHSVMLDRDDFRRLERRHEELSNELQTLIRAIPDAVILQDGTGRVRFVNAAVEILFGLPSSEMVGWDFSTLATRHPRHRDLFEVAHKNTQRAFQRGRRTEAQVRRKLPGEHAPRDFESTRIPLFADDGVATGLVTIVRDVTKSVAARANEDRIRALEARAGKLAALSRLVEGVAHEFENQLTAVLGYSELGLANLNQAPPSEQNELLARAFDRIREAATLASGISRNLLAFSNASTGSHGHCSPCASIEKAEIELRELAGPEHPLVVQTEPEAEGWRLPLSSEELFDLLSRLVKNAAESSASGREVMIHAFSSSPQGENSAPVYRITIEDQGCGIPTHLRERIFDPLFSTYEDHSRRRGMGLAIVHTLVQRAGGEMNLDTEVGRGTRFELAFPLIRVEPDLVQPPTHRPCVLVVDDRQAMRALIQDVLEAGDYEVMTAASCAAAESLDAAKVPDLLLIDVHLQDGVGTELAARLQLQWPEAPALFCSGLPAEHLEARGISLPRGRPLLVKPFRPTELLGAVKEALSAKASTLTAPS